MGSEGEPAGCRVAPTGRQYVSRVAEETIGQGVEDALGRRIPRRPSAPADRSLGRRLFGESRSTRWIAILIAVLVALLVVRPVVRSVFSYYRTAGLLEERRADVRGLAERHGELQDLILYYETDVFLAERARRYGLVREGEQAYVIRELATDASDGGDGNGPG